MKKENPLRNQPGSFGANENSLSRRGFLKRSGGATVATVIAWELSNQRAQAEVTNTATDTNASYDHFRIKALEVSVFEFSEGSEKSWTHPVTEVAYRVKKTLNVHVSAPATEWALSATSALAIEVEESALFAPANGPNTDNWEENENFFNLYRDNNRDYHSGSASITKTIDESTGEVLSTITAIYGDGSETLSGILITTEWIGDSLKIGFGAIDVITETFSVEPDFLIKALTKVVD